MARNDVFYQHFISHFRCTVYIHASYTWEVLNGDRMIISFTYELISYLISIQSKHVYTILFWYEPDSEILFSTKLQN